MSFVPVHGLLLTSMPTHVVDVVSTTIDAVGESASAIGFVELEAGETGPKTISAAGGGSITFRSATVTFSNGSTNFRVGIQDTTTGTEDGAYDVQADLVGGVASIPSNSFVTAVMTSGSKTVNQDDLICIVAEMTARGGADSVAVDRVGYQGFCATTTFVHYGRPYGTADTGSGPAKSNLPIFAMITFDDGTVGWIRGVNLPPYGSALSTVSFNSGTSPNEYAMTFEPRIPMRIGGASAVVTAVASGDHYATHIYDDPFGSPNSMLSITFAGFYNSGGGISYVSTQNQYVTVYPGRTYGIGIRPTTANSISLGYFDATSGFSALKRMLHWGTSLKLAARTNQPNPFVEVQPHYVPLFGIDVCGLHTSGGVGRGIGRGM